MAEEEDRTDPLTGRHDPQDHRPQGYRALTPEEMKARKRRNLAIALALAGFAVFVFIVTVINLKNGIPDRPL
ncbi:hypothetical protein [Euryhalocaulis caribicus]|uniref:hypothetical protein n=1 Tax=Euryhalocaulis caribicus TaxID=1161401 RepID=UPI000399EF5D|nr:hypothetical protein [Euryhalocaulis caribicus]